MGYLKARLEFVESDKKSGYVAEDVYFTSSSQDTFFQLKYFHNQGLDLISPQDLTFFCNRMKLHKVNLVELDNISAWTRAVFSFKSQLSNMTTVSDKTEYIDSDTGLSLSALISTTSSRSRRERRK